MTVWLKVLGPHFSIRGEENVTSYERTQHGVPRCRGITRCRLGRNVRRSGGRCRTEPAIWSGDRAPREGLRASARRLAARTRDFEADRSACQSIARVVAYSRTGILV